MARNTPGLASVAAATGVGVAADMVAEEIVSSADTRLPNAAWYSPKSIGSLKPLNTLDLSCAGIYPLSLGASQTAIRGRRPVSPAVSAGARDSAFDATA